MITEADDGRVVTLASGQPLTVRVVRQTMHNWSVSSVSDELGAPRETETPLAGAAGSGTRRFTWSGKTTAAAPGRHVISLAYRTGWTEQGRLVKRLKVTVDIQ